MKHAKGLCLVPALAAMLGAASPARAADPTIPQCLTASDQSITLRNQHKLREARSQLLVCAAATCPGDVRAECTRRLGDVNAALPSIVFEAKDPAGNDLAAVKVTMDGQPLTQNLDGTSVAIDPGDHSFTFETAGQPTVQKSFVIREAEKERHERIQFGTPIAPPSVAGGPEGKAGGTTIVVTDSGNAGQKMAGFIVGGVGIAGLIAGGAVLGLAFTEKSQSDSDLDPVKKNNDYNASIQDQTIAYVVGGVGAAAIITGVVLLVTANGAKPSDTPAKPATSLHLVPAVSPGQAGLGVVGTF